MQLKGKEREKKNLNYKVKEAKMLCGELRETVRSSDNFLQLFMYA